MKIYKHIVLTAIAMFFLLSCSNQKSLQKYLVEKQDDSAFVKLDISSGILQTEGNTLSKEEKDILKTVKKVNVVAFPIKEDNLLEFEKNKQELNDILKQEEYKTLIKFGTNGKGAVLKYLGEVDSIDELIVFASDNQKGFAVFRLLGDDMQPDKMIKLLKGIEKGDVDISKLKSIGKMFEF